MGLGAYNGDVKRIFRMGLGVHGFCAGMVISIFAPDNLPFVHISMQATTCEGPPKSRSCNYIAMLQCPLSPATP